MGDNKKLKIMIGGKAYKMPLSVILNDKLTPFVNGDLLLDSKDLILKDSRGFYLTVKKESE
jgi:hypothetical protein